MEYAHSVGRNVGFDNRVLLEKEEWVDRMRWVSVARIVHLYFCTVKFVLVLLLIASAAAVEVVAVVVIVLQYSCKCRMINEAI